MDIKTKYNVNDKIVVKDNNNKILTTIKRIEICASNDKLAIRYITDYKLVYEDEIICIDDFLNELNNINKEKDHPVNKSIKPEYHIGELVEYKYNGDSYISIIEDININDKNITYKLKDDDRAFLEKEIKSIKLNIDDRIVFFVPYEMPNIKINKRGYYFGTITDICPYHVIIENKDGYKVDVLYNQILKRI